MKVGIFKFSSCDGCQLSFLELSQELVNQKDIEIDYFLEGQSNNRYEFFDVAFVEGSISTEDEILRIKDIREKSRVLITIGACATSGGVQSIRNFRDFNETKTIYKNPDVTKKTFDKALPVSTVVKVDHEIRGCPIPTYILKECLIALLLKKSVPDYNYSVCLECKRKGNVCQLILGRPCLGPITMAGCNAICPSVNRGCYG
ncbi:Ni/Fe hydrogenase subunit delta, partial [Sulfurihydrogenibium sp.]|uniref:NADH-quinone oxidoreductase subunit B family protein n=1 Tax=Sulfurihydrogenibium sp. TaxID=2053621 RepID=UPI0026206252